MRCESSSGSSQRREEERRDRGEMKEIRIGTRGSPLSLWQANWVRESLSQAYPQLRVSLMRIRTKGDKLMDVNLAKVGGKGLFVKEIEEELLGGADRSGRPQHEGCPRPITNWAPHSIHSPEGGSRRRSHLQGSSHPRGTSLGGQYRHE